MEHVKTDKITLKKFGITMGIIFLMFSLLLFVRHRQNLAVTFCISLIFFISSLISPLLLKPVYTGWMGLGGILAWINTRIILMLIFYLVFTPIGLVIKLFNKDLLDTRIDKTKDTYWNKKEKQKYNPISYEKQF